MRKYILSTAVSVLFGAPLAHGYFVGDFPGLDKLIEMSDAIVILRVDRHVTDFGSPTGYSTHECFIYQTLKGNIPTNERIRLQLMDTGMSFAPPFGIWSKHLMFLNRKRSPDEPTDYRTIQFRGANVRLPPLGHEKMPAGRTTKDKVITLLKRTVEYNEKQHEKEQAFLRQMIAGAAERTADGDMVVWYKLPPVERVTSRGALIPILRIDGNYYTVCRGLEIPLKKCPEGLQWALTPSSMSETTIGFYGPSESCAIHIVDRQRASFDDFYRPDEGLPVVMTRVDEPPGLLDPTAQRPLRIDDFLGLYQPVWFPWVRVEIRKDGERYVCVEQELEGPERPAVWTTRGEPSEMAPLSEGLGLTDSSERSPHHLTYNESMRRFELMKMKSGIRMPLARVSPLPEGHVARPPMMIGIPAWH